MESNNYYKPEDDFHSMEIFPKEYYGMQRNGMSDTDLDIFRSFAETLGVNDFPNYTNEDMLMLSGCTSNASLYNESSMNIYQYLNNMTNLQSSQMSNIIYNTSNNSQGDSYSANKSSLNLNHSYNSDFTYGKNNNQNEKTSKKDLNRVDNSKEITRQERQIINPQATASKDRRRERNKVLARKTRVKKKAELETLRDKVLCLMIENKKLKQTVKFRIDEKISLPLISSCNVELPENITSMVQQMLSRHERAIIHELKVQQRSFCIVNAGGVDHPIVYASPGFEEMTGYETSQIIGRNCRFLQGPDTDKREVMKMKNAIIEGRDNISVLLNYKKDGTPFWNQIQIGHLKDFNGRSSLIIGIQSQVSPNYVSRTFTSIEDNCHQDIEEDNNNINNNNNNKKQKSTTKKDVGSSRSGSTSGSNSSQSGSQSESRLSTINIANNNAANNNNSNNSNNNNKNTDCYSSTSDPSSDRRSDDNYDDILGSCFD